MYVTVVKNKPKQKTYSKHPPAMCIHLKGFDENKKARNLKREVKRRHKGRL